MADVQDESTTGKADTNDLAGLRCPKCEYDLTGLTKPQCPECGESIDVQALRKPVDQAENFLRWLTRAIFALSAISVTYCMIVRCLVSNDGWLFTRFPSVASSLPSLILLALLSCVLWGLVTGLTTMCTLVAATYRDQTEAIGLSILSLLLITIGAGVALTMVDYLA